MKIINTDKEFFIALLIIAIIIAGLFNFNGTFGLKNIEQNDIKQSSESKDRTIIFESSNEINKESSQEIKK